MLLAGGWRAWLVSSKKMRLEWFWTWPNMLNFFPEAQMQDLLEGGKICTGKIVVGKTQDDIFFQYFPHHFLDLSRIFLSKFKKSPISSSERQKVSSALCADFWDVFFPSNLFRRCGITICFCFAIFATQIFRVQNFTNFLILGW